MYRYNFLINGSQYITEGLNTPFYTETGFSSDDGCLQETYYDEKIKIPQRHFKVLYDVLHDAAVGVSKCDYIYLTVERKCNGIYREMAKSRIAPLKDIIIDPNNCILTIETQPYILSECLEENKDWSYNFGDLEAFDVLGLNSDPNYSFIKYNTPNGFEIYLDITEEIFIRIVGGKVVSCIDFTDNSTTLLNNVTQTEFDDLITSKRLFSFIYDSFLVSDFEYDANGYNVFLLTNSGIILLKCVRLKTACIINISYSIKGFGDNGYLINGGYTIVKETYNGVTPPDSENEWLQVGADKWCRCPSTNFQVNTVEAGRDFNASLQNYLMNHPCKDDFYDCVRSDFFGFSSDNSHNLVNYDANIEILDNGCVNPYFLAKEYYRCMTIHQKTDVKFPSGTGAKAELFEFTYDLFQDIINTFNLCYHVKERNGKRTLCIEHKSRLYIDQARREFLIKEFEQKGVYNTKHSRIVRKGTFPAARRKYNWNDDEISPAFAGTDIVFSGACADPKKTDNIGIDNLTTDIGAVQFNNDVVDPIDKQKRFPDGNNINDEGFVLVSTFKDENGQRFVSENNYPLSWEFLHQYLHTWGVPFWEGEVNGEIVKMCSVANYFESDEYSIRYDCNNLPMLNDIVKTNNPLMSHPQRGFGYGEIINILFEEKPGYCKIRFIVGWQCLEPID